MAEYIEREAVLMYAKMFIHIAYSRSNPLRDEEIEKAVNEIPAADVQPVRHGRWINICGDSESPRQCSECLQDFDYIDGICCLVSGQWLPNYCPNCGAKMDGGLECDNEKRNNG